MSLISNNIWAIFSLRNHQKIAFVTLVSKPHRAVNHLLFLTGKTKLNGTPSKIKWKINLLVHCILRFSAKILIEEYKIKLVRQFLYFSLFYIAPEFTSADIIFNIQWKKIFATNFHFSFSKIQFSAENQSSLAQCLAQIFYV